MNQESDIFESSDKNAPSNTGPVTFNTKREKFMVEIRRQSRQNILNRKRFMKNRDPEFNNYKNDPYDYLRNDPEGEKVISLINDTLNQDVSPNEINNYVQMIRSSERLKRIVGIVKLRLILSIQEDTPIQAVIDTNIASELIRIVKEKEEEYLRIEATWCLTNLATGTNLQVQSLIDKGIIPLYVLILAEDNINLIEQAIWGIGNIAGDCIEFRDELLENKCMYFFAHLYEKIKNSAKRSFIKQLVWAASNLSRLKPVPEIPLIAAGIGIFSENLKLAMKNSQNDEEEIQVIIDSIWALSQITNPFTVKAVRKYSILPYIFELLKSDQPVVVHPSLRIVGAFSNGDFDLCQDILDAGGLEKIGLQLNSSNKNIRKEATWIISNICAGTSNQIQAVFNCREVIEKIFMIATGDIIEVQREAVWTICNTTKNMSISQLQFLLQQSVLNLFMSLLTADQDSKLVNVILEAILEIIEKSKELCTDGSGESPLLLQIEDMGLCERISEMQNHSSSSVYKKASKLLTTYWDIDDEDW